MYITASCVEKKELDQIVPAIQTTPWAKYYLTLTNKPQRL